MSNKRDKTTNPPQTPPPVRTGVRARFDPETEDFLRKRASDEGFASVQDYLRDLARRDRIKHKA